MSTQAVTIARDNVRTARLDPWPIPSGQVLDGDPRASGAILWKSTDSTLAHGIWECTPGRFTWTHADETLCLVEGRVTVTPEGAAPFEIEPGDTVFFPEGAKTEWHIHETVRKAFHLHSSEPMPR